jgi:transcriptional regulator with XRE-family HTH domain
LRAATYLKRNTPPAEKPDGTRHELAARSGVHRQTIAMLEAGERVPSWDTVQALARALGVSVTAFETQPDATPPAKKRRK